MNANPELFEVFRGQAAKLFAFLNRGYGFAGPEVLVDEGTSSAIITFKGQNLAIQLILNQRDEDVDCKIARVSNGSMTKDFARDDAGRLVRESLFAMLRRKGVRERLFTKVSGMSLERQIPITLEDFARMLEQHGKDILADSPSVFD